MLEVLDLAAVEVLFVGDWPAEVAVFGAALVPGVADNPVDPVARLSIAAVDDAPLE